MDGVVAEPRPRASARAGRWCGPRRAACPGSRPRPGRRWARRAARGRGQPVGQARARPGRARCARPRPPRCRRTRASGRAGAAGDGRGEHAGTPRRPPSCRWCRSRRGAPPSRRLGRLSAIGTVSRCPASSTRRSRSRWVRARTASPSRRTSRWGSARQRGLHGVGEHPLVAGDTGHVDERGGERDGVGGEVEGGGGGHRPTLPRARPPVTVNAREHPAQWAGRRNRAGDRDPGRDRPRHLVPRARPRRRRTGRPRAGEAGGRGRRPRGAHHGGADADRLPGRPARRRDGRSTCACTCSATGWCARTRSTSTGCSGCSATSCGPTSGRARWPASRPCGRGCARAGR